MRLPDEILDEIEILYNKSESNLRKAFRTISDRYLGEKNGESLLSKSDEAIAYSVARMPATYGAICSSIEQVSKLIDISTCKSLIDVGAGTGSATLAISEFVNFDSIICLERENAMIEVGKRLLSVSYDESVKRTIWRNYDVTMSNDELSADIVVASYILNELDNEKRLKVIEKLWSMTNKILLIVEPGTPKDFKNMMILKDLLSNKGANLVAPCTCKEGCPLPKDDWCHFVARVERTKIQKDVKRADAPFEDEKFTYLAFAKCECDISNIKRIIRHPIIRSNMVEVKFCGNGEIVNKIYTKKDKELYKKVKKMNVGDNINE